MLLSVTALVVLALTVPMMAQVNPFSDVKTDHWAYDAIAKLADAGLVEGYPDGSFGGERTFTRYEMATVFARMLARFESQIDEQIDTRLVGIDAKADRLAVEIRETRDVLESIIGDEAFAERLAAVRQGDGTVTTGRSSVNGELAALELSPEALEVLSEQALLGAIESLKALEEDQDALARRVLRLEGSTPNREEAKQIAQQVVADALAEITGDIELARRAAALEAGAATEVIDTKVDDLDVAIRALAEEYRPELQSLGVRVDTLETRVDQHAVAIDSHSGRIEQSEATLSDHGEQLGSIWDRLGRFQLSGINTTAFHHRNLTSQTGGTEFREDPRDEDSKDYGKLLPLETEFYNTLRLTLESERSGDVYVKASADVSTVTFQKPTTTTPSFPMFIRPESVDVLVTTPGVLKRLHGGRLDRDVVASPFNKYMLDAEVFDEVDNDSDDKAGVDFLVGSGRTSFEGFLAREDQDQFAHGAALGYALSDDIGLTLRDVRHYDFSDTDRVWGAELDGRLGLLEFSAMTATHLANDAEQGLANEVHLAMPIAILSVGAKSGTVETGYNPILAKDLESYDIDIGPDWINKLVNSEEDELDWLQQGDSEYAVWAGLPLLGSETKLTVGQRDDLAGKNDYLQAQVGFGLISGIDLDVLYDRRTDETDAVDKTLGFQIGTSIIGVDVDAKIINRENDQAWAGSGYTVEPEQKHTYITAKKDIDFFLPLQLEGRYGTSRSAAASDTPHTYIGVGVEQIMIGNVALNGSYGVSNNHVDPKYWWINDEWSGEDRNELVLGAGYTFNRLFGFVVDAGYEYKQVTIDGTVDGDAQHAIKTAFQRGVGAGLLGGEAKYVIGGIQDREGNDRDLTAKLNLHYPVFEGGTFKINSVYVSSQGEKSGADVYEVFDLKAGLEIAF